MTKGNELNTGDVDDPSEKHQFKNMFLKIYICRFPFANSP